MRATWWEGPGDGPEDYGQQDLEGVGLPPADMTKAAQRTWLAGVSRLPAFDPRRRRGGHERARRLLADEVRPSGGGASAWRGLVTSVQRHTANAGLSRLHPDERQVITMAYLEGMSNREIASQLGVSVSTVRRRLSVALGRLDEFVRRGQAWVSTALLLTLAWLSRFAHRAVPADWSDRLTAVTTAVAVAAVVLVVADSPMPVSRPATHPSTVSVRPSFSAPAPSSTMAVETAGRVQAVQPAAAAVATSAAKLGVVTAPPTVQSGGPTGPGCHSNPTSAAPPVPVGSPSAHPTGAPVTHPSAGGCKG